jgi:hypothetical protein
MSLQIKLQNEISIDGNVIAEYEENSGDSVNAEIQVYINSIKKKTRIPVVAELDWIPIKICKLKHEVGKNTHIKVEILPKGSEVVNGSDSKYYENYIE